MGMALRDDTPKRTSSPQSDQIAVALPPTQCHQRDGWQRQTPRRIAQANRARGEAAFCGAFAT
jgi:hypothetical protein